MQKSAFVAMPYGHQALRTGGVVDFDRVYQELLNPAITAAGFEVKRSDEDSAAGDIRIDIFFRLVTADLVVVDTSVPNANVYYELGVRHGIRPGGVYLVTCDRDRPFDIAPDRSFYYDPTPFTVLEARKTGSAGTACSSCDWESFANTIKNALAEELHTTGSPVYSSLPGLKPANWDEIDIPRTRSLSRLAQDWRAHLQEAQTAGRVADILTLADTAPSFYGQRLRCEAARALIALSRYSDAERVLDSILLVDPEHTDAQLDRARVLFRANKIALATQQLERLAARTSTEPAAANVRGQVFRYQWHMSWANEPTLGARRLAAARSPLVQAAIAHFLSAHKSDPNAHYYAGFNALMLWYLLKAIKGREPVGVNFRELKTVIAYVARDRQPVARTTGDHEQLFWLTTALGGLAFIEGHDDAALDSIQQACGNPGTTLFQLTAFRERLELLEQLEVRPEFVRSALAEVDKARSRKRVVVD